ncbi:MAG TPA: hypothetical protein VK619_10390 [Pyrinomonadaceae bacterium]|nr:hypothetical protein [Pyrinomonadaceae bacterium]
MKWIREQKMWLVHIYSMYRVRKQIRQPDLRVWEFVVQMLCSAYLSWRWLGSQARFKFWSLSYWSWLAEYSQLWELSTRASLAAQTQQEKWFKQSKRPTREEVDEPLTEIWPDVIA